jgi:Holliday junction resolvasome RuvABC endonuclease subunit
LALVDAETQNLIDKTHIPTAKLKLKEVSRLIHIENIVGEWLKRADLIVIEGYAYGGNNGFSLGELGGILKRRLFLSNKPFYIIQPDQWRKALFGRGRPPKGCDLDIKEWVQENLKDYLDTTYDTTDESDATGLALLGTVLYRVQEGIEVEPYPKHLSTAVAQILDPTNSGGKKKDGKGSIKGRRNK